MRPSILIVDDEKVITEGLARLLSEEYQTSQAQSGREAIDIIRGNLRIDVVLCDLIMPEMNGIEIIRRIRSDKREIPVIIVTAFRHPEMLCDAMREGAHSFLFKPLNIPLLEATLRNVIGKKSELSSSASDSTHSISQLIRFSQNNGTLPGSYN